ERTRAEDKRRREAWEAYLDGPEGRRDLLLLARDRVRAELLTLSASHTCCAQCGGFGRQFQARFLQDEIDALTTAHGLDPVDPLPEPDWATRMGVRVRGGKRLDESWMEPERKSPPVETPRGTLGWN
ncbi:MAG: hypothetical protein WBF53_02725, partial [Litorimonas sp.]